MNPIREWVARILFGIACIPMVLWSLVFDRKE